MLEVKKPHNQGLRVDPAWSVNTGKIDLIPDIFLAQCGLKALASFSGVKRSRHYR